MDSPYQSQGYARILAEKESSRNCLFVDRKDIKEIKFLEALKTFYGPKSYGATTLINADGSPTRIDKDNILERWAHHFNSVLNRSSSTNGDAIRGL